MLSYTDKTLNKNIEVTDYYGKKWLNLGTYSYKADNYGRVKMKGRLNSNIRLTDNEFIPYYLIEDTIGVDTKNIMSVTLVKNIDKNYVCHIVLQPNTKTNCDEIINSAILRLQSNIPEEILKNLYINVRSSFLLAPSGKRDTASLTNEKINENCINCYNYLKETNVIKKIV